MHTRNSPVDTNILFQQACQLQQNGRLQDAELMYTNLLKINPSHVGAKAMLGSILVQSERDVEGIKLLKSSLTRDPKQFWAHNALGVGLLHTGRYQEAIYSLNKALILKPDYIDAYFNLGKTQRASQKYKEALISYSKCIELDQSYADAFNNRGVIYLEDLKDYEKAITNFQQFLALVPNAFFGYYNLGNAHKNLNSYEKALASYDSAIQLNPYYAEAYSNRAAVLGGLKRYEEALASYDHAIQLKPDYPDAYNYRGGLLVELKRYDDAFANYNHAIQLKPDYAEAYHSRGNLFFISTRYEEALKDFDRAFQLKPGMDYLLGALLHAKMHLCDWSNFHALLNKMTEHVIKQVKTITPFAALALIDNPELQKRTTEIYIKHLYSKNDAQPIVSKYPKHQKIRIGYFSADFREHPVSSLTVELFELHNRDQFEVIAFSFGANSNDPLRKRLEVGFDQFIDVSDKTDTQITLLAREMEIDIAVDLGGLTGGCRTGIFAARAAPVQVNYLGYPGTMSAEYMDYIIADPTLIPDEKQCDYSEKVAYLPNTYMVNDSSLQISEVPFSRKDVEIPEKAFVFACFNASYKITPATFLGWMRILSAIENSVLWLSSMNQTAKNNLQNLAVEQGIDKDRIIFASRMPSVSDHLNRIRLADLFLDTFPFNAHTTSNDALRVGLPVLTLMGESFPSRVAASLLNAVNLPELITTHQHEYEALAIDLGSHPEKLVHIKNKLKSNLETSPLCNTKLFAQHIESLYQVMYQRQHDELTPDHIYINNSSN